VDILPTIADFLQFPLKDQRIPAEGRSFAGAIRGEQIIADSLPYAYSERKGEVKEAKDVLEKGIMIALQDSKHKLILHTKGGEEFYDLAKDPFESRDCKNHPAERLRIRNKLNEVYKTYLKQSAAAGLNDPVIETQYIEELKALGYIN
jgi:hypothetical protein